MTKFKLQVKKEINSKGIHITKVAAGNYDGVNPINIDQIKREISIDDTKYLKVDTYTVYRQNIISALGLEGTVYIDQPNPSGIIFVRSAPISNIQAGRPGTKDAVNMKQFEGQNNSTDTSITKLTEDLVTANDKIDTKQNTLVAGNNITIEGDLISATGGGTGGKTYDGVLPILVDNTDNKISIDLTNIASKDDLTKYFDKTTVDKQSIAGITHFEEYISVEQGKAIYLGTPGQLTPAIDWSESSQDVRIFIKNGDITLWKTSTDESGKGRLGGIRTPINPDHASSKDYVDKGNEAMEELIATNSGAITTNKTDIDTNLLNKTTTDKQFITADVNVKGKLQAVQKPEFDVDVLRLGDGNDLFVPKTGNSTFGALVGGSLTSNKLYNREDIASNANGKTATNKTYVDAQVKVNADAIAKIVIKNSFNVRGVWTATDTYAILDLVFYDKPGGKEQYDIYISRVDGNINLTPNDNPTQWAKIGSTNTIFASKEDFDNYVISNNLAMTLKADKTVVENAIAAQEVINDDQTSTNELVNTGLSKKADSTTVNSFIGTQTTKNNSLDQKDYELGEDISGIHGDIVGINSSLSAVVPLATKNSADITIIKTDQGTQNVNITNNERNIAQLEAENKTQLNWTGEFVSGTTYKKADVVTSGLYAYASQIDNNNSPLTDTVAWFAFSLTVSIDLSNYYTKIEINNLLKPLEIRLTNIESFDEQVTAELRAIETVLTLKADKTEVTTELALKQNTLIAGENITIVGDTISSTGAGAKDWVLISNVNSTEDSDLNTKQEITLTKNVNQYSEFRIIGRGLSPKTGQFIMDFKVLTTSYGQGTNTNNYLSANTFGKTMKWVNVSGGGASGNVWLYLDFALQSIWGKEI